MDVSHLVEGTVQRVGDRVGRAETIFDHPDRTISVGQDGVGEGDAFLRFSEAPRIVLGRRKKGGGLFFHCGLYERAASLNPPDPVWDRIRDDPRFQDLAKRRQ